MSDNLTYEFFAYWYFYVLLISMFCFGLSEFSHKLKTKDSLSPKIAFVCQILACIYYMISFVANEEFPCFIIMFLLCVIATLIGDLIGRKIENEDWKITAIFFWGISFIAQFVLIAKEVEI